MYTTCRFAEATPLGTWDYASPLIVLKAVSQRMLGLGGYLILWSRNGVIMNYWVPKRFITSPHTSINIVTKIFESRKLAFGAGGHT